ncbi:hypothetical protein [Psychromonas sp. Urea-02u-13]|uniref:hypothetical protein n=1 Tax=Psychromonas sp. Urea-02u-13 TaxID=2058326 RepID=UPI000C34496C|nr:hypothetical protein [Psychromonas sp. Urea-02u-13]PKG37302.1 hypothetical protein CXF74_19610 [Psychromonas sp. Urea-02u-13]
MLLKLLAIIIKQIEYLYAHLIDVLVDELIDGERNPDQGDVIQALLIFTVLAVFSFYMEPFVELYTFIGVISLVIAQFINLKNKTYKEIEEDARDFTSIQIARGYFEHFCMILFLIFFSNFLPKAGHFIMSWVGPWLGIEVPRLVLDLSMSGIWSVFAIEIEFLDVIDLSLLVISFMFAMKCWHKAKLALESE